MGRRVSIVRQYDYAPQDIAVAFYAVATKKYGADCFLGPRNEKWIFRRNPVVINSNIKSGPHSYSRGIGGRVVVRGLPGIFSVAPDNTNFIFAGKVPSRKSPDIESFLNAIQAHLTEASIYRGRAITTTGEFLDLSGTKSESAVYNERVFRELKAHVWTIIEQFETCNAIGVRLPRKILFEGPFGSGKTLAALITAQKASACGWTFIYVAPTSTQRQRAPLNEVMEFARYYEPAIVFLEDIDREQREYDQYYLGSILSAIDGIASKTSRVLFIMSTNFRDKITAAMHRPGRIDKVIDFGAYTSEDRKNLLLKTIPSRLLSEDIDWHSVKDACDGFPPAFVMEMARSAMLLAVSESQGSPSPRVSTKILVEAATGLQGQFKKTSEAFGFCK